MNQKLNFLNDDDGFETKSEFKSTKRFGFETETKYLVKSTRKETCVNLHLWKFTNNM